MVDKVYPKSQLPIRKTVDLLPTIFQTTENDKFLSGALDPMIQPGTLEKIVGYIGRRYGKTYSSSDIYIDTDQTLRSRYQLEPGVTIKEDDKVKNFYDYLDFKNQLKFFGNNEETDNLTTFQEHYSWNPPIDWDKFVNYREYYWVPSGPPSVKIYGQAQNIRSTYKVTLGSGSVYIFTPDGLTNNPAITLYRGQTYKFNVTAPGEGFVIRSTIDTGSLQYLPSYPYKKDQLVIFDNKIWKAKQNIDAIDGSTIDLDTQDWEFVDEVYHTSALDYVSGITNNGVTNGTLTFEVPLNAPDILYYQSLVDPNRFGRFLIADVESNTKIDVETEIIGKATYTSSNGVTLSNGMVVTFEGQVTPEKYSSDRWLIEGVGTEITLTRFQDLTVDPSLTQNSPEILFDNGGFDSQPFDDARAYPDRKDYITINRSSIDSNPWSRYNRWFHRSVLDYSNEFNNTSFEATETSRAKRPIIEFKANLQMYNHGSVAKRSVDYIDNITTDVFSIVEGSSGYIVDGEKLFEGARVLFTADTDTLANNRIYKVTFIKHNNSTQISLIKEDDTESVLGECVLVSRGNTYSGKMFYFDGSDWLPSQAKTTVNQPPLFDIFDSNGVSFSDSSTYPVTTFAGSKILSYKIGSSTVDTELGFSLSYLNIDNVGDIQFNFDLDSESFNYQVDLEIFSQNLASGFYKFNHNGSYDNGWKLLDNDLKQPIVDSVSITSATNLVEFSTLDWDNVQDSDIERIVFYLNGYKLFSNYTRNLGVFTFDTTFAVGDVLAIKIFADLDPMTGYYEIPLGLEKNPLNQQITSFTLGQAVDHVSTGLDLIDEFSGVYPGISNLRDISGYENKSRRFLKHSASAPLAFTVLCDKEINIIKSLEYSARSYTEFKNHFIALSETLYINQDPKDFIDEILNEISKTQTLDSPFSYSDMLGSGAYSSIVYEVEDPGITTFALSQKFDLETLSNRAVYVYKNNQQLITGKEYQFNSTFGFVNILIELAEGDIIEVREYVSTSTNFIPPTPTKLGFYKKFTPSIFVDDTYISPKTVIQGHDGSITVSYGDYRDELLLELELRIYNNIKIQYDESIFDIDNLIGGYYKNSVYGKTEFDIIVSSEFLKWISNTNIDYISNRFFDSENTFTFTYSNMTDPSETQNLPGWWRGVYLWFYDTDRPHRCPWEMLGFSEQPDWWESVYGPAPYTKNNLILWEDLRDGIIRQGSRAGIYDRYKRPTILEHIPTDADGKLLSPLDSGLARNYVLINNKGDFKFGDVSPSEAAWRWSSEYPFAVVKALCLLRPFEFITDNFNRTQSVVNILNQTVNSTTNTFTKITDLKFTDEDSSNLVSGLFVYIKNYLKSRAAPISLLADKILGIDVNISSRIGGFVDPQQQKYILDSKNPKSTSSSIFIPQENYDIIFNISSPITSISYSGVVLEKVSQGWKIAGYDNTVPYFNYFKALTSQTDPLITVGGVSENFLDWTAEKFYGNGVLVRYKNSFYRSVKSHTSVDSFESSNWKQLPALPVVGAVEAFKRRTFNTRKVSRLTYGTILQTVQAVVDFLLGYQEYLKYTGIVFDRYDPELKTAQDWFTSAKEFMFWSKHNWALGSLLTLSPAAQYLEINNSIGVVDNLLDSFYDYQVYKNDGTPLQPKYIDVKRDFQKFTISTSDTVDGIYFFKAYYVLKEHVAIFDDRTVFNDVIYDKTTGYRQERIKVRGFRTVDWDGDYTSPGFLFDNVDVQNWEPYTDYKLGDIVSYKSYYWTSKQNQLGSLEFQERFWTKLDLIPSKGLVPNFDYRINQIEDYYDVDTDGVGSSQRSLARHVVGYQQRDYLQNIAEDEITQFRLYQGFVREKGTANSIVKLFDKTSRSTDDSVVLNEEWAFLTGQLGGTNQYREIEFKVTRDSFLIDPQPILITESSNIGSITDQYLRVPQSDFTLADTPFTKDINPTSNYTELNRSAGYVNLNDVDFIVKNRDDILSLDISSVNENDHIWITFDNTSWTVLRYNESTALRIVNVLKTDNQVEVFTNRIHGLAVDDIIGIFQIFNLTGFYKIISVTRDSFTVETTANADPEIEDSISAGIGLFTESRFKNYETIDPQKIALLDSNTKLWIDNNGNDQWEVIEKTRQYQLYDLENIGISDPSGLGESVIYVENLKHTIASIPGSSYVMVYSDSTVGNSTVLNLKQIIDAPLEIMPAASGVFGQKISVSPDGAWLAVGTPMATGVVSKYIGELSPSVSYRAGDIVKYQQKTWVAVNDMSIGDGSSINFNNDDWEPVKLIEANSSGDGEGFTEQGVVTLYKYRNNQWEMVHNILSPRPQDGEKFGSAISIGVSNSKYYMAVSAVGANNNTGRVYLFVYENSEWKQLEDSRYIGLFDPTASYAAGSVVWYENELYEALNDVNGDGSSLVSSNLDWQKIDAISTNCSLPSIPAINDDGSTLASIGLLNPEQMVELVKEGDSFGYSQAMTRDGSILIIGCPSSDGQYFPNYKGEWKVWQDYLEGDVVKYQGYYHQLVDEDSSDSTITSRGQYPDDGSPWINIGDSTASATGKIYIYQRQDSGLYNLTQTITAGSIVDINDTGLTEGISSGDQFGFSIDIDASGTTLVVSSPQADVYKQNNGAVYVFKKNSSGEFRLTQKLESYEYLSNEFFGSSVSISQGTENIVIGARNSSFRLITGFETGTTFDRRKTSFSDNRGFPGQVYVFERKDQGYFLAEKLYADTFINSESFGSSVDCTRNVIVVGSPTFEVDGSITGRVRLFKKDSAVQSLNVLSQQTPSVDLSSIKNIELYDIDNNYKIKDIDIVDHFKMKILGVADQDIKFKTIYDPAVYEKGIDGEHSIDESRSWFEKNVGQVWWDLSTVKFVNYEQSDISYRIGNWNSQVVGSSIDVYEWVETPLLPSEWSVLADTTEGLAEGISGQPKYSDDTVYNTKVLYNSSTGQPTGTLYYFWVKNKTTIPSNVNRSLSVEQISSYIDNPQGTGIPYISLIDADKFLAFNFKASTSSDNILVNIEYYKTKKNINNIHKEYQLLTEGVADSLPSSSLERKWIDSLVGSDEAGNAVPDPSLPSKQKYGLSFRPRQSMFVNRSEALKLTINYINSVLLTRPFADLIDYEYLNLVDEIPTQELNEYDVAVDTLIDLDQVGTIRIRPALLSINIIDGEVDTIDIVDTGFGYRVVPPIVITGTGKGATAVATIDTQGRLSSVTVLTRGRKYSSAIATVRPFSVLVVSDSSVNNYWSVYGWDSQRNNFYKRITQDFNTTRYWNYIDWWATGYSESSRIIKEIIGLYQEPTVSLDVGDLLRIKEYSGGGWAVLEKTEPGLGNFLSNYNLVGRENGTLQISENLYNKSVASLGYDTFGSYDSDLYDLQPNKELRNILLAAKENIFVDDLRVEWNKLFFACIKYAFSEQAYVDWAFKTSFVNAIHNVGDLFKKPNYKSDNLESYQMYIDEVKPYRTTVREYTSRYTEYQPAPTPVSDFDLPPAFSVRDGEILPVNQYYNRLDEYPWKWWSDNYGYSVTAIELSNSGSGYRTPPTVLIEGDGTGATAKAYISSGKVTGILVTNGGSGYKTTPTVTLVGGNGTSTDIAKAIPILGNGLARSFNVAVKFDRISKEGLYQTFVQEETFTATGSSAIFNLKYAPSRDKAKIKIVKNNQPVLSSDYELTLYKLSTDNYSLLKGKLRFFTAPASGDIIVVTYEKNDEILDSINRIEKYYSPTAGMKGKQLNQLMTGIDYGGVQVQGTTFDVTGGWDALPWFTDNWDSVESNSDYYYVCDGSTTYVVLPFIPEANQLITIYLKRVGTGSNKNINTLGPDNAPFVEVIDAVDAPRTIRIDDLYWNEYDGVTVQPNGRTTAPLDALMPTFVGDGSTNVVDIQNYLHTDTGDILIFRTVDSDGSVTITDINLLDTRIDGGSLSHIGGSYTSAVGITPEEIVIDGSDFINPDQVPATEENIPGQVLDSLSIKVFTSTTPGSSTIQNSVFRGDGNTKLYNIGLSVPHTDSILVYINKEKKEYSVDYTIDFVENKVEFITTPADGETIEIIAIGLGGVSIIDYQEFEADGDTKLYLTNAVYDQTASVMVTVDGEQLDVGFINSSEVIDVENRTMVQFGANPARRSVVKIVCFGSAIVTDENGFPFIRANKQTILFDGSTRTFDLDKFVNLERASVNSSILVDVNGKQLKNVDTTYITYNGTNNNIILGVDPSESIGTITSGNIRVYINNELQRFVIDYTYNGNENLINVPDSKLSIGDVIRIETDVRAEYYINGNSLVISSDVSLIENDEIVVTWFSEYPTMDIVSDEFVGGKLQYNLSRKPVNSSYVWVYKNGERLTPQRDYSVNVDRSIVKLTEKTLNSDYIKIVQFGNIVFQLPKAFEIYKDMLNNYHYKRYSKNSTVLLAKELNYYDTEIEVTDASSLATPSVTKKLPGVIIINKERIEYFTKIGNVLGQLRRGSLGTAIGETYPVGSNVVDVGYTETIPYNEGQEKYDFVSDGSTLLVGPLDFNPIQSVRSSWTRTTIPAEYGPCDTTEVFVGGTRLRKDPIAVYNENNGAISPDGDEIFEAEFSVSGDEPYIRLTNAVPAGTRISIVRRVGRIWYDRGTASAASGITLLANETAIAKFIGNKTTELPE